MGAEYGKAPTSQPDAQTMSAVKKVVAASLAEQMLAPAGAELVLTEWTAEASIDGTRAYQVPLHRHPESDAWYVLEGVLCVHVGDEDVEESAGGAVIVPGGTPHTFWSSHPETVRYVPVMGSRTHALVEALHASENRSSGALGELFESHGAELLE